MSEISVLDKFKDLKKLPSEFKQIIKFLYVFDDRKEKFPHDIIGQNAIFVTDKDELYIIGNNTLGCLGIKDGKIVSDKYLVKELSNKGINDFHNGYYHVIARNDNQDIFTWGYNNFGQLGRGPVMLASLEPERNEILSEKKIVEISCGDWHTLALTETNEVYAWGNNKWGQILSATDYKFICEPVNLEIFLQHKIVSISCGSTHSMALTSNGLVFSWGSNDFGQLGLVNVKNSSKPPIIDLKNVTCKKITCCQNNSFLLLKDGSIYGFGEKFSRVRRAFPRKKIEYDPPSPLMSNLVFTDIASSNSHSISVALSEDNFCYELGKDGETRIGSSQKTIYKSFLEYFTSEWKITQITINFRNNIQKKSTAIDGKPIFSKKKSNGENKNLFESRNDHVQTQSIRRTGSSESLMNVLAQPHNVRILNNRENERQINQTSVKSVSVDHNIVGYKFSNDGRYASEFEQLNFLGKGTFGNVYEVKHKENQHKYAIKIINIKDFHLDVEKAASLKKEIEAMVDLVSHHVVQYYSSWAEYNNTFYIQMELCHSTLKTVLEKKPNEFGRMNTNTDNDSSDPEPIMSLTEYFITCEILKEIIDSLHYLHNREPPIIHRDLKPDNILISKGKDEKFVKIGDFGLAVFHTKSDQSHTARVGTSKYTALEVSSGRNYDTMADIHSLGVIMQQMFDIDINSQYASDNKQLERKFNNLKDLLLKMVQPKIIERPNTKQIQKNMNSWALTINEIQSDSDFMKFREASNNVNKLEDNFFKYFLKKKLDWNK